MNEIDRIRLPFREQIDFFRGKLNLPSERWDSIEKSAHDRGFIVAGAQAADLVADLRGAVDGAIAGGDTLADFRKNFDQIVGKHGWTGWAGEGSKAGVAWRTKVIYGTNVRSSYAAGRWAQLNDPELLAARPYWRYIHNDSVMNPRPQHLAWHGLTLRHDHPFFQTNFAPNGWGCRCTIMAVRGPAEGDATAPPAGWDVRNAKGDLPGVDKGWDYAPGARADEPLRNFVQDKLITLPEAIGKALSHDVHKHIVAVADPAGFVREALANRQTKHALWLGFVDDRVSQVVGQDLSAYLVLAPQDAVRHADGEHGGDNRTQRAPQPEDYADAGRWLTDGQIEANPAGPDGKPRILVRYATKDGEINSVWEVRAGKKNRALALVSMWVKR
jgi:hypothetical protein